MLAASLALSLVATGCNSEPTVKTWIPTQTSTPFFYQRKQVDFYRGIIEPRAQSWQDLVDDSKLLLADGFNAVAIQPPVLIPQRAGKRPRLILEGEAASASYIISELHEAGLAVHLAPTTKSPNLKTEIEPTEPVLNQLSNDTLKWAQTAEEKQVELFSPLSEYNLVLGTTAGEKWSQEILPKVREKYHGPVAAKVLPDLGDPPSPGSRHDFELMNYKGYDYLMLDIFPTGSNFNQEEFAAYVDDLLKRATVIAQRDGLKGVMVGEFGCWREAAGGETADGPQLGADGQAAVAAHFLDQVMPNTKGVFFQGWTLPGRGAKGYPVEEILKKYFGSQSEPFSAVSAAP